jgi:ATP-binding protein involved in chromosome partitioning
MSYFQCPNCEKRYDIFGSGGARRQAEQLDVPFLGEVPIQMGIRERGDAGETSGNFQDAQSAPYLREICQNLVRGISTSHQAEPPLPTLSVL